MANWIWLSKKDNAINTRGCFATSYKWKKEDGNLVLHICAVTKYMVYLNGKLIGRGPVRDAKGIRVFDAYSLEKFLEEGENYLAVRVWNYGLSTYQSLYETPCVSFVVTGKKGDVCVSDETVKCCEDLGVISNAPKRNVNLGFSDYYDARYFDSDWIANSNLTKTWRAAVLVDDHIGDVMRERNIKLLQADDRYPKRIVAIQDVVPGCQEFSVNVRQAFFPNRRDADETIFAGFIGGVLISPQNMTGVISFPNRTWNGIIGDFKIDGTLYPISSKRREQEVFLTQGEHFFAMQISGCFDDLYIHMEMSFPEQISWKKLSEDSNFFVIGPTDRCYQKLDGISRVYGGLDEFERMEQYTPEHIRIWEKLNSDTILEEESQVTYISSQDIYENYYILSMARKEKVVSDYSVQIEDCGILWDNEESTIIRCPQNGQYRRMILDFGKECVGELTFTCRSVAGTIIDIYGFENMFMDEIDYTIGLNNAIHYVTSDGWQKYQCMTRMGMRYCMITVRGADAEFSDFHIRNEMFSFSEMGYFESDDDLLNRIFLMCRETNELCTEDSFTDCPMYEQAYWIGDAQLSSMLHNWMFGDYEYTEHNQRLSATAIRDGKMINALTPTDWHTSIPMWMMNWVIAIFEGYDVSGRTSMVERLYPQIKETLLFYCKFIKEDGAFLINAWNMLDWADLDISNNCVVTGQQGMLAYCLGLVENYALESKREEDAKLFGVCKDKLLTYIDEELWDPKRKMFLDGWSPETGIAKTVSIQTHTLLYLYNGILSEEKKKIVEQYLDNSPEEFIKVGSPFMLYFLYESQMKLGKSQEMISDMKKRWGEMLYYNSTTCWEVFPGFYENNRTRSYCHSWSATPAYFMLRYGLGIKKLEKGFKKIKIEMSFKDLNWCRGAIPTPFGMISIEWTKKNEKYNVLLKLPEEIQIDSCMDDAITLQVIRLKSRA